VKTEATQEDRAMRERLQRVDTLLQEVDGQPDGAARSRTKEIVQGLMEFHGAGIERILEKIASSGEAGQKLIDSLAEDELIASLLLLYGLHPLDLTARVAQALENVRPYLHSHGGNVELLGIDDGVVRLRLQGSCHGCPSSAMTLKQTIEEAIHEKAPDAVAIEVEGESKEQAVVGQDAGRFALPILAG
jgi:Fe-S cluster biogenesis protein NfuA